VQPPASSQALAEPIYEAFYGLREEPFAISTDPKFFFMSAAHQRAHEELLSGLQRREALLLVSGETGTGKTTLCRAVIDALGDRTFFSILHNPYMLGTEMLRLIVRDFGLVSKEEMRHGALAGADTPRLLEVIESFLRSLVSLGSHAVVVIDEAQSLSPTLLDEMRMLTAFEHEGQRLLQVVLCGQPRLLSTLKTEAMYALNERITRRVVLTPLQPAEVDAYIRHRLAVAGGTAAVTFEPAASQLVSELSRGLPRRVNVLCDRALQEGRIAGQATINGELVKRAARALAGAPRDTAGDEDGMTPDDPSVDLPVGLPGVGAWLKRRAWFIGSAALATVFLAGGLSYGYYARTVLNRNPGVPEAPARPALSRPPAGLLAPPTDDELAAFQLALKRGSGEFPDNRDQVD
jgi:general secretion pathway protein A